MIVLSSKLSSVLEQNSSYIYNFLLTSISTLEFLLVVVVIIIIIIIIIIINNNNNNLLLVSFSHSK